MQKDQKVLLAIWQEVARHLSLKTSLAAILKLLQQDNPLLAIRLFKIDLQAAKVQSIATTGQAAETELPTMDEMRLWFKSSNEQISSLRFVPSSSSPNQVNVLGKLLTEQGYKGLVSFAVKANVDPTTLFAELSSVLDPLAVALQNQIRLDELQRLTKLAESERQDLLQRMGHEQMEDRVVGATQGLAETMDRVSLVALSESTVLILGETGSGKEIIARAIHEQSDRKGLPFIRVNCGAIPTELIDSELFGHEKGSFTGAAGQRRGWFERADGGTLFLDEVGELPLAAQVRLLRVVQEGTLTRVGAEDEFQVNVRIIAATHRNLLELVQHGQFREDLWYRLNVFPIYLPALRDRKGDIPALAKHFAQRSAKKLGIPPVLPTESQCHYLAQYHWPGNIREMQAVIERAAILGQGISLELEKSLGNIRPNVNLIAPDNTHNVNPISLSKDSIQVLDTTIMQAIENALQLTYGRVEGPKGAARLLGLNANTLRSKMRKYGIQPPSMNE